MIVQAVIPTPMGAVVLLSDAERASVLQVAVGHTEGLTIALRHARRAFERPLTHDLLDEVLSRSGATVVQVRIDDLVQETFVARVTLQARKRKEHVIDARASDSIALALGHDLPVFVSQKVIEEAAVAPEDLPTVSPEPEPDRDDPHEAL